ncbi:galactokinase [Flagellimonas pacifica]|uniref:Galactokinase n=1 Tax=Flagellimonas pacifica TaxID=1247520 RepID=A0A285MTA0_9FLAO|nr:galactokinase [Allomuricauda parva]SNZ00439.1 galactokinase [Allomuricauda parva]
MNNIENLQFELIVSSPGRINFIGEHTDYNNGYVLPTAIDRKIVLKLRKNQSQQICTIHTTELNKTLTVDLTNVSRSNVAWENYALGVLHQLLAITQKVEGFDCVIESFLPVGSGVSSSAALECGLAYGLNELFDLGIDRKKLALICRDAEHSFVGTKCGIMDQYASLISKKDNALLIDCASIQHEYVPLELEPYKILLLNTNVSHNLSTSEYNTRREECKLGVDLIKKTNPDVNSLRDVTPQMLQQLKNNMDPTIYKRCEYVVQENNRVLRAVNALQEKRLADFGALLYGSHDGLQNKYEVSCPELDFLVDYSRKKDFIIGSRMIGGGFGGCTINIIHQDFIDNYVSEVSIAYKKEYDIDLSAFTAVPVNGTTHKYVENE